MLLAELERNSSPDRFNTKNCARYLKVRNHFLLFDHVMLPQKLKERMKRLDIEIVF